MKAIGFTDRGVKKRTDLTVIYKPEKKGIPVVLLETGFIDNEADNKLFDSKFDKIVKDIVECIADEMKLKKKSVASAKPVEKTVFKNGDYNKNVKTTANLNVRAGRGTDYKILGTLEKGTVVKALYILEKDGVPWASIDYGKDVGYISLNYVTPVK
jgi:N-acetylmuramoyl-L-alanine amidase